MWQDWGGRDFELDVAVLTDVFVDVVAYFWWETQERGVELVGLSDGLRRGVAVMVHSPKLRWLQFLAW